MQEFSMRVIARIHSDFAAKFGVPRQSGLVDALEADIIFEPEFRNPDALRGLDGFSHLWLLWIFDQAVRAQWSPTVRPPRLGGNTRLGVFATRSPFRPNPIARLNAATVSNAFGWVRSCSTTIIFALRNRSAEELRIPDTSLPAIG